MATLTLDAFMKFSREQAMEQADLYAKQRAEERSDDLNKFSNLLENCVQTKIDEALNPVIVRQEKFEEKTERNMADIAQELAALKACIVAPKVINPSGPPVMSYATATAHTQLADNQKPAHPLGSDAALVKHRFEAGRLTLGFEPIHKSDLDRLARMHDIQDRDLVMKLAIWEFLRHEMNIKSVETTNIVKAFPQHTKTENDCIRLYAQFTDLSLITHIYNHVSRLRTKEQKVVMYVPSTHIDQGIYLDNIAYTYRYPHVGQEKSRTRVKYGRNNLYLQFKPLSSSYWTTVSISDSELPPGKLRSDPVVSYSPPAGRQRDFQNNKRAASTSPQQKDPKVSRTSVGRENIEISEKSDTNTDNTLDTASSEDFSPASTAATVANDEGAKVDDDATASHDASRDTAQEEVFVEKFVSSQSILEPLQQDFKSLFARRYSLNSSVLT